MATSLSTAPTTTRYIKHLTIHYQSQQAKFKIFRIERAHSLPSVSISSFESLSSTSSEDLQDLIKTRFYLPDDSRLILVDQDGFDRVIDQTLTSGEYTLEVRTSAQIRHHQSSSEYEILEVVGQTGTKKFRMTLNCPKDEVYKVTKMFDGVSAMAIKCPKDETFQVTKVFDGTPMTLEVPKEDTFEVTKIFGTSHFESDTLVIECPKDEVYEISKFVPKPTPEKRSRTPHHSKSLSSSSSSTLSPPVSYPIIDLDEESSEHDSNLDPQTAYFLISPTPSPRGGKPTTAQVFPPTALDTLKDKVKQLGNVISSSSEKLLPERLVNKLKGKPKEGEEVNGLWDEELEDAFAE